MSKPDLIHEATYTAMLKPPVDFGPGPMGHRMFFEVTEGTLTGPRLNGRLTSGGGDWITMGSDGMGRVDVRAQITTDDGASIFAEYFGLLALNDAVMGAMASGQGTGYEDQYFRTTPRFSTGDERYLWLTQSVFLAVGRLLPGSGVEYELYRVG